MKVLQVINSLNTGGAEKLLVDSISIYQKNKIEMDVLLLKKTNTFYYEKLKIESKGEKFYLTNHSLYNPLLIFKIIPFLKKYDVIHIHLFPGLYWVVIAKIISFSKVKLIFTEHNTLNRRRYSLLFKYLDKIIYSFLNSIVCITNATEKNLKKHLGYNTNLQVIYNGIQLGDFEKTSHSLNFFNEMDSIVLVQVSSFREQKDQETLIKSLKLLPKKYKLLLVGEGKLLNVSKELVNTLSLQNRVIFLGNRRDVPEILNYSDIVIQSSNYEGFGLAALEGMASRKPVIASNVDGLKQIVEGYGLLFENKNYYELSDKILKLGSDKNFYEEIALKCYERSLEFSIEKMVENYINVYKSVHYSQP